MKVTELAPKMPEIHPYLAILTLSFCFLYYLTTEAIDRLPKSWWSKTAYVIGQKQPAKTTSVECPYSYIRQIYGKHHWAAFVRKLSPNLKQNDPIKYEIVNEIMDAMHLCLMLVDDVRIPSLRSGYWEFRKILITLFLVDIRWERLSERTPRCSQNLWPLGDCQPSLLSTNSASEKNNS